MHPCIPLTVFSVVTPMHGDWLYAACLEEGMVDDIVHPMTSAVSLVFAMVQG